MSCSTYSRTEDPDLTCMAWASSRRSSSVFIVTNLSTNKFSEAATMARPNSINISANITYSGFLFSALSRCRATMSPKPWKKVFKLYSWLGKLYLIPYLLWLK